MRVAILSHNARQQDAVGNQIAEKVRFFHERGAEVRVFVEDARQLHAEVRAVCAVCTATRDSAATGPIWDYLRETDIVIAVYSQYYDLLQFLPALVGVGPRIVVEYLGVTPPPFAVGQQREGLQRSVQQRGYVWCADHVLTTSRFLVNEISDATGWPRDSVSVLPLPIDVARFVDERRGRWLHERLRIDGRILLYVGRLARNKRVPLLIEALAQLTDPNVHVAIVGATNDVYADEAAQCVALARELGLSERVHLLGSIDDAALPAAYRSADVFVMPSLHEGFCVPLVEAMASGLPAVASRSAALPETLGGAGLTFTPEDAVDLAHVLNRVLPTSATGGNLALPNYTTDARRIAVVSFRYGPDVIGGAETSLRSMANHLSRAGQAVEIFTTCTTTESHWHNELPAGTTTIDDILVHRFPIDAHEPAAHGAVFAAILAGAVAPEDERRYLATSIHSSALIDALRQRRDDFDAIVVGPYLFGLTADVLSAFPGQTLVAPCFHDEPLARLAVWPNLCRAAGGILYHSREERDFAQAVLGINHPNSAEIGACVAAVTRAEERHQSKPYVLYCGRYSEQKNLPLLLEWAQRYHDEQPGLDFVFIGRGPMKLPREPWLRDLGCVAEGSKRALMRDAAALVQLSTQESLSLVVLEAWAEGTPVVVHADCAVLKGQIERSKAGVAVADYATFAAQLDDLRAQPARWCQRGECGRTYVAARYGSTDAYVETITQTIERMRQPIARRMGAAGVERAVRFERARWHEEFAEFSDRVLTQPPRPVCERIVIEPMHDPYRAAVGASTLLATVRLHHHGTHAAAPDGPGRTEICWSIDDRPAHALRLPTLLLPGQTQVAVLPIALPESEGSYRLRLWTERNDTPTGDGIEIDLHVDAQHTRETSCASAFLDTVADALPRAKGLEKLPIDYVDVTEGRLAPVKRFVKEKLLHNFKHAYVDVLSRQQSEVNGHLVLMVQQLAECCAALDHAVRGIHERLDALEEKIEQHDVAATGRRE